MRRYAFTRAHARGLIVAGWTMFAACVLVGAIFVLSGAMSGLTTYLTGKGYAGSAASVLAVGCVVAVSLVSGLVVATPFVVAGELILVVMDQRAIAAKHLRIAKRIHRAVRPRSPDDARVRRRRVI
jgi:hypothetical protein